MFLVKFFGCMLTIRDTKEGKERKGGGLFLEVFLLLHYSTYVKATYMPSFMLSYGWDRISS